MTTISSQIVDAALGTAAGTERAVAEISLAEIARQAGMSRATLYRRIGSRRALNEAVRAAGVDPGGRPEVRERAIEAAAAIVRERGLGALTLPAVARRADCSVPALYTQLGGKAGLVATLFERYSPLAGVESVLARPPESFEQTVRALYGAAVDSVSAEPALLGALLADALAHPHGPTARLLRDIFLQRVLGSVGRWLAGEVAAGRCRPLPLPLLLQLFIGPVIVRVLSAALLPEVIAAVPASESAAQFAGAFCRAVSLETARAEEVDR
jgi:AcrR family transcriptional regulator